MDKFTKAVRYYQSLSPEQFKSIIHDHWFMPKSNEHSCLFERLSKDLVCPTSIKLHFNLNISLQQPLIKNSKDFESFSSIIETIKKDKSFPDNANKITQKNINKFAVVQRKAEKLRKKYEIV